MYYWTLSNYYYYITFSESRSQYKKDIIRWMYCKTMLKIILKSNKTYKKGSSKNVDCLDQLKKKYLLRMKIHQKMPISNSLFLSKKTILVGWKKHTLLKKTKIRSFNIGYFRSDEQYILNLATFFISVKWQQF